MFNDKIIEDIMTAFDTAAESLGSDKTYWVGNVRSSNSDSSKRFGADDRDAFSEAIHGNDERIGDVGKVFVVGFDRTEDITEFTADAT